MKRHTTLALLATACLLATGCGQGSGPKVASAQEGNPAKPTSTASPMPSPAADEGDRAVQFQQCMAQHGVPVETNEKGGVDIPAPGDKSEALAATEACRIYLPGGGERTKPTAEELETLRQITQCIRDKGFPGISDPDPDTGQFTYVGPDGPVDGRTLKNNPQFRTAMEACQPQGSTGGGK